MCHHAGLWALTLMSQMLCFHCANKMNKYTPHQAQNTVMNQTASVLQEFPIEWENPCERDTGTHAEHPPSHLVRVRNQLSTEWQKIFLFIRHSSRRSPNALLHRGQDNAINTRAERQATNPLASNAFHSTFFKCREGRGEAD